MTSAEADRCARLHRVQALRMAYQAGDLAAVKAALGWPESFPNTAQPMEFACGDCPLVTAISLSPLRFVRQLLDLGADPNFEALDGFPSLIAAMDARREDAPEALALLLHYGADIEQRGINDWTPLHYAVATRNLPAVKVLLTHGADPDARTRIDDLSSVREDAAAYFPESAALMRPAE